MENFEFLNPVKILFGKGQIAKLRGEVPKGARLLVTYGAGSIKRNGVYDQVMDNLQGHTVSEFGGIEPNPEYETLMKAVGVVKRESIDFLVAVGGGSVLDGTKFIAAAARFEGEPWDIPAKNATVNAALPLGVVLTLPATGSEMNCFAVVSRAGTQEKFPFASPFVYPKFSIIDPQVTFTLPARQVGNGIVDAFAHVLEQYLTYPANAPLQDRFAESILLTLIEEGPKTLANPADYNSRANLCWCASMALNGLIRPRSPAGLNEPHGRPRAHGTAWLGSCSVTGCRLSRNPGRGEATQTRQTSAICGTRLGHSHRRRR
jgi:NADP-dependent alcohol dehydrogenase